MNPPLSILATLKESLLLAKRHFRLVLVMGIALSIPAIASDACSALGSAPGVFSFWYFLCLPLLVVSVLVEAATRAAVLATLAASSSGLDWLVIQEAIRSRSMTLVRVSILLALMVFPLGIFAGFVVAFFHPDHVPFLAPVLSVMAALLFVIFMKYALADPLVVIEKTGARESLKQSWGMTRGHFWYVAGCYLLFGGALGLVSVFLKAPELGPVTDAICTDFIQLVNSMMGVTWITLAWCMYTQIKAVESSTFASPSGEQLSS